MAGEGMNKKKIMVAIDESDCSHYALDWALKNLGDSIASSSPLMIFTAQPVVNLSHVYASSFGVTPPELIQSVQDQQRKISLALLQKAKEICSKRGVDVETITEVGDPKEAICVAVENFKISLLILGSHGRGAIKRAFLGSVSNYCMKNANCPVLVVKKPA
ncbi:universal stress protein A-like protein isoform X1 [Cinnamomum micranthum f. kanehirae]|uniref:Universal stress protein A-like protein isoform X1 n=1 Tax=Cinnamomum micranthum f. kanehirae TaxID=337451 RepID=A0A443PT29_9MAGN|nr:universal stress protein A-like protein isoform X1 [Cinnamomum micranthum f. kanehirae]